MRKIEIGNNPIYHWIRKKKILSLPTETKDLYSENYKILMKEIKDDTEMEDLVLSK